MTTEFDGSEFERFVEDDLPNRIISYVNKARGIELRCDEAESIEAIFLSEVFMESQRGHNSASLASKTFRDAFGEPEARGDASSDPILGQFLAWERFRIAPNHRIRIGIDNTGQVKDVTLMTADTVP
ncbi:MAG: hypothetical protein AAF086_09700 [Planctomycetota bacterium]